MGDRSRRPPRFIDLGPLTVQDVLNIVELRTKVVSVSSFLIGTLIAVWHSGGIDWPRFLLMFAAVLAVDMGTTGFNSYFDLQRGVDHRATNRETDKVLLHRGVAPGAAFLISAALFALAMLLGGILGLLVGAEVVIIGAVAMAVGFLYTGGPRPISASPFGELFAGGFLGWLLIVLAYYVQTRLFPFRVAIAALPSFVFVAAILAVNNACDIAGDAAAGRRTLAVLLGPSNAARMALLLPFLGFATAAALGLLNQLPRVTAVTATLGAIIALPTFRAMRQRGFSHATKGVAMRSIAKVFVVYSVMVAAPLLSAIIRGVR